jgi:hypothetical protein
VQESVDVWLAPRTILVGDRLQVRPAGATEEVRATVPVNALTGATVTVEVVAVPAVVDTEVGLAFTVKSGIATLTAKVVEWDNAPLAPVIVTVKAPLAVALHERDDVPAPVTLVGFRVQLRPVDGDTVAESATAPLKLFTAVTVTVEVAVPPTLIDAEVGLALIVKSWTMNATAAVWVKDPLVPVTVTVKVVAVVEEQDKVEVWLAPNTILAGVKVHVSPAGETAEVRATVPVNPLTGATVMVEVPEAPTLTLTLVGEAVTVKFVTVMATLAVWVRLPLVPVTVTV